MPPTLATRKSAGARMLLRKQIFEAGLGTKVVELRIDSEPDYSGPVLGDRASNRSKGLGIFSEARVDDSLIYLVHSHTAGT